MNNCIFCRIIAGDSEADFVRHYPGVVAFKPLNPVVEGHILVVPEKHVTHLKSDPDTTGIVVKYASYLAQELGYMNCNVIINAGEFATQTVDHLHIHLVPRVEHDGLFLPWTFQHNEDMAVVSKKEIFRQCCSVSGCASRMMDLLDFCPKCKSNIVTTSHEVPGRAGPLIQKKCKCPPPKFKTTTTCPEGKW